MENQKEVKNYVTSDLKLQAFLRLMLPDSFIGLNKSNPERVSFIFKDLLEISDLVKGYFNGKKYTISPLSFANNIDQGKAMIFGNYDI